MIVQSYPATRKVSLPVVVHQHSGKIHPYPQQQTTYPLLPKEILRATKLRITNAEYSRRDAIVRKAYKDCPFYVGDKVTPDSVEGQKKYGTSTVTGLVSSYFDYGDDWPKNDNPLIVMFTTNDGHEAFSTVNYFKKPESKC